MKHLKNVTTLMFDVKKCIGCGRCVEVCPHEVFIIEDRRARITDRDACMECGACAKNCPVEALSVKTGVGCASGIISEILRGGEACCDKGGCCG